MKTKLHYMRPLIVAAIGIVAAATAAAADLENSDPTPAAAELAAPNPGDEFQNPADGSVLVWIPGGKFDMGNAGGDGDESPVHPVEIEGFWLGKYEVTNEQFARFLEVEEGSEPWFWGEDGYDGPNQPVVGMAWARALAYCQWAGVRLPTEAEWEYAAGCGTGLEYPTATGAMTHDEANYQGVEGLDTWAGPAPVGSFPKNCFGLYDMAGNAWELTSTSYKPYPYDATDGREDMSNERNLRVSRGGGWQSLPAYCRTTSRHRFSAHLTYDFSGFRVALSAAALAERLNAEAAAETAAAEPATDGPAAAAGLEEQVLEGAWACPYVVPLGGARFEISSVAFQEQKGEAVSNGGLMPAPDEGYRNAFATVKVTKPAGMGMTIAAADLTLHYRHAQGMDVAPCVGISAFSTAKETERPIGTLSGGGAGWQKQTTGTRSTEAEVMYFDAVFHNMEPDADDAWLCIGQPTTSRPFRIQPKP